MALIKCEACDKEVSENAISCPGCGEPIQNKKTVSDVLFGQPKTQQNKEPKKSLKKSLKDSAMGCLALLLFVGTFALFIWGLLTIYSGLFPDSEEKVAEKEIKQSDTYNEAAKKLAEIEAKIKLEEAFIANLEKDYKKAYKLLSPLAEQGNGKAQFRLGVM